MATSFNHWYWFSSPQDVLNLSDSRKNWLQIALLLNFNSKLLIVVFTRLKLLQQSRNLQPNNCHNSEYKQSKKGSTLNTWH